MVHMHHSQPLKIKFWTNHFLASETLVPLQYREHVKLLHKLCIHERLSLKVVTYSISDNIMS